MTFELKEHYDLDAIKHALASPALVGAILHMDTTKHVTNGNTSGHPFRREKPTLTP